MNCATDGVVLQLLHLEALVDDTLASDGSITVDNNGHDLLAVLLLATEEVLLSTATSSNQGVHGLEMRWVSHQSKLDFMAGLAIPSAESGTQMVLDVTSAGVDCLLTLLRGDALELSHDHLHGFAHDIGQSVQTTSVRHSDNKGPGALFDSGVDAEFEAGHEGLATFETEALHRVELASHESTPLMGPVEALVHVNALSLGLLTELDGLKLFSDPITDVAVLNVHELHTDLVTVGLAVCLE